MTQRVEGSIEIQAPVEEVYAYWETLENLPYFMKNVEEVRATGADTTHWRINGPFATQVEFDARTTAREQGSYVGWSTLEGDVGTSGEVCFSETTPGHTRVDVSLDYANPPGSKIGEQVSRWLVDPQVMLEQDLVNLRDILELRASPEEVRARPSAATARSAVVAVLVCGTGLVVLGLALLVLRRGGHNGSTESPVSTSNSERTITLPGWIPGREDRLSSFTLTRYRWLASPEASSEAVSPEKAGRPARRELRVPGPSARGPRPRASDSRVLERGARRAKIAPSEGGVRDKPVVLKVLLSPRGRRLLVRALKSKRIRTALKDKRVRDALKNRHARRLVYRGLQRGLLGSR